MRKFNIFGESRVVFFAGEKPGENVSGSPEGLPKSGQVEAVKAGSKRERASLVGRVESARTMDSMQTKIEGMSDSEKADQVKTYNKERMEMKSKDYAELKKASSIAKEMYWANEAGYFKDNPGKTISKIYGQRTKKGYRPMNDTIIELNELTLGNSSEKEFMSKWDKKRKVMERAYGDDVYTGMSKAFHLIEQFEAAKASDGSLTIAINKGKEMYSKQYEVDKFYKSNPLLAKFSAERPETAQKIRNEFYAEMKGKNNADQVRAIDTEKFLLEKAGLSGNVEQSKVEKTSGSAVDTLDNEMAAEMRRLKVEMRSEASNLRTSINANDTLYRRISEGGDISLRDLETLKKAQSSIARSNARLKKVTDDYAKIFQKVNPLEGRVKSAGANLISLLGEMVKMAGEITESPGEAKMASAFREDVDLAQLPEGEKPRVLNP